MIYSLEKNLSRYTCLTKGETINIKIADRNFLLNVLVTQRGGYFLSLLFRYSGYQEIKPDNPNNCICVIEADVEVDFAPPLDYKEPEPNLLKNESALHLDDEEEGEKLIRFHF